MPFNTPLRYPGGKGRLTRYVAKIIELNDIQDGCYVEPYAGGAGVAISLLFQEYVRAVVLNDISQPVYAFWRAVLDHTDELCRLIKDTPVTIEEWRRQRHVQTMAKSVTTVELGFSTFFLNRTNHSGIIQGGVIGGQNQSGKWKLDARYNKVDLIRRIEKIARYRNRIRLFCMDASEFIVRQLPSLSPRTLVYLDPPYYAKGGELYEHHYTHRDHAEIATLVQEAITQPWIVSYDNHPEVRRLYRDRRQQEFDLYYSANRRFQGKEIMVFCDSLNLPEQIIPSRSTAV